METFYETMIAKTLAILPIILASLHVQAQSHIRPVEEGKKHLDQLLVLYPGLENWEARKNELRQCILETLNLSPFPDKNPLNPIYSGKETMDGYTVEHAAIESLPGVYVCGSLYKPVKIKGKLPAVMIAQGHGEDQHYAESAQKQAAMLARMGAVVFSYDMFAKGESALQFAFDDHRTGMALTMQTWNSMRVLDFMHSLAEVDTARIAMTGASGGGTQTFLLAALDNRVAVSAPVIMVSSWFNGGCPCESGLPVHACGELGTNNAEIAAMFAPKPMLIVSDGSDWTAYVPDIEFPYVRKIYRLYGAEKKIRNIHLKDEKHDYGPSKREAVYDFMAKCLNLDIGKAKDKNGNFDEPVVKILDRTDMLVFGKNGERMAAHAIKGMEQLQKLFP